ncbi:MAG: hypothetical protein ISS38_03555 [Candidatus Cloacimonetes bacterium]|nr:hypothetical protein [Candidatus Cloacimonadota bacterium]
MKKSKIIAIAVVLLLVVTAAFAKQKGKDCHKKGGEVVGQYRTLEMLKVLDLTEGESEDVLPIIAEIGKNRETFHFERNQTINEIEFAIKQEETSNLKELSDKLLELQKNFDKERVKLFKKLRSNLSEEQFAKFIIFNRSFGSRLHEKMSKMKKERCDE